VSFAAPAGAASAFLGRLNAQQVVASTVPANGDVNPYGVAVVRDSVGDLVRGDVLVSNFNNSTPAPGGTQGLGSTIVEISPAGVQTPFAQISPADLHPSCPGGVGLTTALTVLRSGFVVVGSLPTDNAGSTHPGCLIVLNSTGRPVTTISGGSIAGPWDMTSLELGPVTELFVTNVLNGPPPADDSVINEGTVVRLVLETATPVPHEITSLRTTIASGFGEHLDPAALVVGPTGLALSPLGTLYVADTVGNRITAIPNAIRRSTDAGTGNVVSSSNMLNGPLGAALAPNGNILTVNGGDGNIVETTPSGAQVAEKLLDNTGGPPPGAGALFGLAVRQGGEGVYFVDDSSNTLNLLRPTTRP
jgi:hypothetical protein